MANGTQGKQPAKKPKKAHVPNPPRLPAGLAPIVPNPLRAGKR